jgi:2-polyprenyl-3-methyl-5-hydroxy-6-metoxy-1,4-benzoquinol methylase
METSDLPRNSSCTASVTGDPFDAILCLWNVLGHIESNQKRLTALKNMKGLLSPKGTIFIDVNNRYNANSYGYFRTLGRLLFDVIHPPKKRGCFI